MLPWTPLHSPAASGLLHVHMQTHFTTPPTCSIQMQIGMKHRCKKKKKKNFHDDKYFHDEP